MGPVLKEEITTLPPTQVWPVEVEGFSPAGPLLPCMCGGVIYEGTHTIKGAQVEDFELGQEWLSPQGFGVSMGLLMLHRSKHELKVHPFTL